MPSIYDDIKPLELDRVKTYPLASRNSKVNLNDFAKPLTGDSSLEDFLDHLPNVLAVRSLRQITEKVSSDDDGSFLRQRFASQGGNGRFLAFRNSGLNSFD